MPKFELARLGNYEDASLAAELQRVSALVPGRFLSQEDFDSHSKCSASAVRRRFGGWDKALAAAGLRGRFSGGAGARGRKETVFSDNALVAELQRVAGMLGSAPLTIETFQNHGRMNAETIRRRFGSWGKGLARAGLSISKLGRRYSDDDYFDNLLAVWTRHGRQPTYGEMDEEPSRISTGAYEKKWGTWRAGLLAFVDRAEKDTTNPEAEGEQDQHRVQPSKLSATAPQSGSRRSIRHDRRACDRNVDGPVRLGLRYKVLLRDCFRCVLCGANPSVNLGCELHVDHILPRSRGGKTVLANLRTLCLQCNLGKGSKIETDSTAATGAA